jgi:hypothetical protein
MVGLGGFGRWEALGNQCLTKFANWSVENELPIQIELTGHCSG